MPNWCSNTMVVYGSSTEVKDFRNKCLAAVENGNKLNHWHLYQIFEEFGYKEEEILKGDNTYGYNRGNIEDVGEIERNGDDFFFKLYYESAWGTMIDGFDYLLKHHYKTLRSETLAEECGCEVYINTDVKGRFFTEKFVLDIEDDDIYYLETEQEVIDTLNKHIDLTKFDKVKTLQECYDYLEDNDADEIGYISLHEFEPY